MKIRVGFVSNSSSSSFCCDVCGEQVSGYNMCLSDAEMYECENGHTICDEHIIEASQEALQKALEESIKEIKKYSSESECIEIDKYVKENLQVTIDNGDISLSDIDELIDEFDGEPLRYYLPEVCCPLCNFEDIADYDYMNYLEKTRGISKEEVFADVKSKNSRRKKLRPEEYIMYVCNNKGITVDDLLTEVQDRFNNSYKEFKKFLRG